ncbi:MAG: PAS domain S-box protein [bacterium]
MEEKNCQILLVEDDKIDQMAFERFIKREHLAYDFSIAESISEAKHLISENAFDIIVSDYCLGDGTAFDILRSAHNIPIIIITGVGNEELAVRAMKTGISDYLIKDSWGHYLTVMPLTIKNAIRRQQMEESLRKLSSAVEQSPSVVVISDINGIIEYVNPKFTELTGYVFSEIIGKNINILKSGVHTPEEYRELWNIITQGGVWRGEFYNKKKDSGYYWESATISSIKNSENTITHFIKVSEDITKRKKVEEKLCISEQKYRTLYENLRDGCVAFDMNGIIQESNMAFQKMCGYSAREICQITNQAITPKKWWPLEKKIYREQVIPKGYSTLYEKEYQKKDGTLIPVELTTYLIKDDNDNPKGMWAIVRDITKRKRTEEELERYRCHLEELVKKRTNQLTATNKQLQQQIREHKKVKRKLKKSEEKYHSLYSSMNEGVALHEIIYDKSGHAVDYLILDVNQSYATIVGMKRSKIIEKRASVVFGSEAPRYLDIYAEVARTREPTSFETYFPLIDKYLIIFVFSPCIGQFATVFTDISERKLMEQALQESEAKYSTLVEQAKDAVFIVQNGIYKFANRAAMEITGYTMEELLEKPFEAIFEEEYKEQMGQRYEAYLKGEESSTFYEAKLTGKDGTIRDVEISISLIQYNGKSAIMGTVRDITERKKIEQELQKTQKLESLGLLAGGIAHDFNNLLTAIIGKLSLGEAYAQSGDNIFEVLRETKNASKQAKKLTQQLLTFSTGGAPIKKATSVAQLLKESVRFALSGSMLKSKMFIPDDLWCAEIDEGQINQVINNLIINASQAMPEGGVIEVRAENVHGKSEDLSLHDENYIKITIKDQGHGISREHFQKIFDPYFTTKPSGSGLGLAITYSIIKNHGGHITVDSAVDIGTTFNIYIPALVEDISKPERDTKDIVRKGKGKILFMEDYENLREIMEEMLNYLGYEVELAEDGAKAIDLYKKAKEANQAFDATILDLTIPGGMGGKEVIKKLREIDPEVKAIVSSGYSHNPVMSNYKHYGFSGVVVKPYEIAELSSVLNRVIAGKD